MNSPRRSLVRVILTIIAVALVLGVVTPWAIRFALRTALRLGPDRASGLKRYLGVARSDGFLRLDPASAGPVRLTTIAMQAAQAPESGELVLDEWEGVWLVIEGRDSGGWIYAAEVWMRLDDPLTVALSRYAYLYRRR